MSLRSPLAALGALLLLAGVAAAGDLAAAKRKVGFAKDEIETQGRYESALRYLSQAETDLVGENGPEAETLRAQIGVLRAQAAEKERQEAERRLTSQWGRLYNPNRENMDDWKRNTGAEESIARDADRMDEFLKSDDVVKNIPANTRAEMARLLEKLRNDARKWDLDGCFREIAEWIQKIEDHNSGKATVQYTDTLEQYKGYALDRIGKAPNDPRKAEMQNRLDRAWQAFERAQATGAHDEAIKAVVDYWAYINTEYSKDSEGWETEQPHDYAKWRIQGGDLNLEKTENRVRMIDRMLDDDRYTKVQKDYPTDPAVVKLVAEVTAAAQGPAGKITKTINGHLDQADKDTTKPTELKETVRRMVDELQRIAKRAADYEATLARAKALHERLEKGIEGAAAAKADLEKKLTEQANKAWPDMVKAFGDTTKMDPVECLKDLDAWRGKTCVFSHQNRAGWDYDSQGEYEYIIPISGTPVAAVFDGGLLAALNKATEATGIEYHSTDLEDVVAVVEGQCRVTQIEYSQLLQKHLSTAIYDAPRLRIVAFKSGPYAMSVNGETSLAGVEGMPEITPEATGSGGGGGGGGGFFKFVFGCLCCSLLMAGAGGGAFFAYQQQQKAAAAKAAGGPAPGGPTPPAPTPPAPPAG